MHGDATRRGEWLRLRLHDGVYHPLRARRNRMANRAPVAVDAAIDQPQFCAGERNDNIAGYRPVTRSERKARLVVLMASEQLGASSRASEYDCHQVTAVDQPRR